MGPQMTGQADPRPKESVAVWTGDGGGCCRVVGSVLPGRPAFFSHGSPVGLACFGTLVDS